MGDILIRMSNAPRIYDTLVDDSPEMYMRAKNIYDGCVRRLREMDKMDANRPYVAELMKMARAEMERQAKKLPY